MLDNVEDFGSFMPILAITATFLATLFFAEQIRKLRSIERPYPGFPLVTLPGQPPKDAFFRHGNELLEKGFKQHGRRPFQVMTGTGPKIVLRNHYGLEVGRDKRFNNLEALRPEFFENIPGFEAVGFGFRASEKNIVPDAIRKMTPALSLMQTDILDETRLSIEDIFGHDDGSTWHVSHLRADINQMVARMTARIFLSQGLSHDQRWLDVTKNYTVYVFNASRELRLVSPWWRWLSHRFNKNCQMMRRQLHEAKSLVGEEVARREAAVRARMAQCEKLQKTKVNDGLGWFIELGEARSLHYSVEELVYLQLTLGMAAQNSTTETIAHAIRHLCEHPDIVPRLREEVTRVLAEHGWSKQGFYQLKLLDSFLKESQRLTRGLVNLHRKTTEDVVFQDGLKIPQGCRIIVETTFWEEEVYGTGFDAERFLRLRERSDEDNGRWQYHNATNDFSGFGYGDHACPARWFVENEVKTAMAHFLLQYDWEFIPGEKTDHIGMEEKVLVNPMMKVRFRSRTPELDLEAVPCE